MGFIAGSYSATWGGSPLGMVVGGFNLSIAHTGMDIIANRTGQAVIDSISTGADVKLSFVLAELDLEVFNRLIWDGPVFGEMGELGTSQYLKSKPLTMSACTGVGAPFLPPQIPPPPVVPGELNNQVPSVITFFRTHLLNGHEIKLAFTNRHRTAEIMLRVFPRSEDVGEDKVKYTYFEAT